ncbi:phage recombination protein Bet [Helicobacter sp. 12S02634-8]|uniref:phage recombination protein Bet n=1 Tax=Helicobacter sp. 12S02634-8 TaxID=1476199 RepID=UPI000BC7648B|nr:phage recombination protein Bet [Helicobacter sp. 12S02634-8]PAF46234.1 phage recombination protein Bet [Helicobacter sp. 12S02634-8]
MKNQNSLEIALSGFAKNANMGEVDTAKLKETLKATVLKQTGTSNKDAPVISDEEFLVFLTVANKYQLNPFTSEIYAFPSKKGIIPIVGVDGWYSIINRQPTFQGFEFNYSEENITIEGAKICPTWCEAIIYRSDRTAPIKIREYLDEVYRPSTYQGPWQTHTKRMLRHKALIQCGRAAFGFSGLYDEDEGYRIVESQSNETTSSESPKKNFEDLKKSVQALNLNLRLHEDEAIVVGNTFQKDSLLKQLGFSKNYKNEYTTKVLVETKAVEAPKEIATPTLDFENTSSSNIPDIKIPPINNQDEFKDFLASLGLTVDIKTSVDGQTWARLAGNTEGLQAVITQLGFEEKKGMLVANISHLALKTIPL